MRKVDLVERRRNAQKHLKLGQRFTGQLCINWGTQKKERKRKNGGTARPWPPRTTETEHASHCRLLSTLRQLFDRK